MPDSDFQQALQYYALLRQAAFAEVQADALGHGRVRVPLRLAGCTAHTLTAWRATWAGSHPSGRGGWDWEVLLRRAWKHPAWFHLGVWSDATLCGLAVGRVSGRSRDGTRNSISVEFIESAHDRSHPLRGLIAPLVVDAAEAYGRGLGARYLRLMEPLPGVVTLYERLGFATVWQRGRALYCERRIER